MINGYKDLLPSYLKGANISKHADVIEAEDNMIYNKIHLLSLWNSIERPILVERVQEEPGTAEITIHINTKSPIKKITSNLQGFEDREYAEEELVTTEVISKTVTDIIPPVMPKFTITVETYDGTTYKKGYLENDVVQGDVYDHDEFLDIIGNLIGIPRRIYKDEVNGYDISVYEGMYPKYFTKQMYSDHHLGYITEDDYYYAQRLQKFISESGAKPLVQLMAELLYEWDDTNISSMKGRTSSFNTNSIQYKDTPVLQLTRGTEKYNNIDYSNMSEILNSYAPLTRPIIITTPTFAYPYAFDEPSMDYINNSYEELYVGWEIEDTSEEITEEGDLFYAPVQAHYIDPDTDDEILLGTYYTDNTGKLILPLNGLPLKTGLIKTEYVPEYEYYTKPEYITTETVTPSPLIDMSVDAWKGIRYANTQESQYVAPFFDNMMGVLNVGRRCLCHTPIINLDLIDITEHDYRVTVEFSYTNQYQKIGLVLISENSDGTAQNRTTWIDPYTLLGEDDPFNSHILECRIQNGILHYYIDGEDTSITQTLAGYGGMLYIAGYNITALSQENPTSLYIWDATFEEITTVTDDCTTLNKWLVTDSGTSASINSQPGIPSVRPPSTGYQRVYWKYPLIRGTNSSIKFKVYITANAVGIILGSMLKNGSDHMTNVKSWWGGLGSTNNWSDGPTNTSNRHGGARMSYNTWHTIEFKLEDNVLHTYVDNVSVRDYTIPNNISTEQYFNNYFFLAFSGNAVWVRDIEYTSNTNISEDTLEDIRSAHLAQFE